MSALAPPLASSTSGKPRELSTGSSSATQTPQESSAYPRASHENSDSSDIEEGLPYREKDDPNHSHDNFVNDHWLVTWDGPDDPENPLNWTFIKKVTITTILALVCLVCTFNSAIFSTGQTAAGIEFGIGAEVMNLGTALFVLGYAVGPMIFAPLSEQFGRKYPLFGGYFLMAIFTIAAATSKDVQTLLICRFFGGVFGSSPLVLVGSMFADYWAPEVRGVAICFFAIATFVGPSIAPVVGGFIVTSYLGWRWTLYLTSFMAFFMLIVGVLFCPETLQNAILSAKAARKREETGQFAWHHKSEEKPFKVGDIVTVYLARPMRMFFTEPIVLSLSIYVAFVYALLYLLLSAVPIAFAQRGWKEQIATLPFISLVIGCILGSTIIYLFNPYYIRAVAQNRGRPAPKARLLPMVIGGFIFPTGLFIFAFTADIKHGSIFWLAPCIGLVLTGCGLVCIFLQSINYLIDVYLMYSASAIAANTIVRSLLAAALTMVATYMFENMHVEYASLLLALLALVMAPIPILFYVFDEKLRKSSAFAPNLGG